LVSGERSLISSMLLNPTMRVVPRFSAEYLEETLTIGSPMVFQTTPPQPASNARWHWYAVLEGGPEATQKGLGDLMPARSIVRSAIILVLGEKPYLQTSERVSFRVLFGVLFFEFRHSDRAVKARANRRAIDPVTRGLEGTRDFLSGKHRVHSARGLFAFGNGVHYFAS